MSQQNPLENTTKVYPFLLLAGIIVISLNLRPAITSVGPLLGQIRDDINLTSGSAALLTSLPLVAFAVMSPFAARLGNRYSYEGAMLLGLILIFIGMTVRSASIIVLLLGGTFILGLGIAIINVLLPGLIKDKYPLRVGLMTSIYSTTMGTVAAIASGVSIPVAETLSFGWQGALFIWTIPAILGIFIWIYLWKKADRAEQKGQVKYAQAKTKQIWRSPLAWQIAAFMGLQSFIFYVTVSWVPEIIHAKGFEMETAGWILSVTQFIVLPASFIVPVLTEKMKSQIGLILGLSAACLLGYSGLLVSDNFIILIISTTLIGIFTSGAFAFALTLFALRTRTAEGAAKLSGMAQTFGYVVAATGPILIGVLYDASGSWSLPIITIMVVICLIGILGVLVGRERYLDEA